MLTVPVRAVRIACKTAMFSGALREKISMHER